AVDFAQLLEMAAVSFPKMRIRFSTSNPQDMHEEVLHIIAKYPNICEHIHLPVQSGSDRVLKLMNRLHTRAEYMALIDNIRRIIPNVEITQDMIAGFPTETEEDHLDTLSLMEYVKYNFGYMYAYSERPGTLAGRRMEDDVPEATKLRRLQEIVDLQRKHSGERTKSYIGKTVEVLIEKVSKKSPDDLSGRNPQSLMVVFPKENYKVGEFVDVKITNCTSGTLIGEAVGYSQMN
ncbi:MAG: TRAM domain-containing protein, partial [Flavobacterium sp.]